MRGCINQFRRKVEDTWLACSYWPAPSLSFDGTGAADAPGAPVSPAAPAAPGDPLAPAAPAAPGAPALPAVPVVPCIPVSPVVPVMPVAPVVPVMPGDPVAPGVPAGPGVAGWLGVITVTGTAGGVLEFSRITANQTTSKTTTTNPPIKSAVMVQALPLLVSSRMTRVSRMTL